MMKNKYYYLCLILSLFLLSFIDGNKKKNDLEIDHIHGHVKSIHEYDYLRPGADKNDIDPLKIPLDDTVKHATFNYDKNGNLIEHINNIGITIETFTYENSLNRIHSKTDYAPDYVNEEGTYLYDNKGNLIEYKTVKVKRDTIESKTTYKYNDKGILKESDSYDKNKYLYKWIYKFDDKGHQTEVAKYNDQDGFVERWTYKYDDKGNNTELAYYADSLLQKFVYSYNEYNDRIEEILYGRYNTLFHTYKYEYVYDKNGNWVKKFQTENGLWKEIILRVFDYY